MDANTKLWTIGYERLWPGELAAELSAAGVQRLIDVRYRPQSRRPGMSKTRLARLLEENSITYEHRRELGTPPEIRVLYRTGATRKATDAFREHIRRNAAAELDELAQELADGPRTALMCLEAEPTHCHRSVLAAELQLRNPGLQIINL
jgi:uncharacterized protein (DUF488 family)